MYVLIAALFNTIFTLAVFYLMALGYFFSAAAVAGVGGYVIFSLGVIAGHNQRID